MKNGACAGIFTLWLLNIAMENGPYKDDFPIKTFIYKGFSIAMLVITRPGITDFCRLSQTWSRWGGIPQSRRLGGVDSEKGINLKFEWDIDAVING